MALDEGWPERMAEFEPWMAPGPDRHWGRAGIAGIGARAQARMGHTHAALSLLARPVRALSLAPAWAPNYTRTACEVVAVVESALRDKALPADFRFPMTDARLALARLCVLDGRTDEARRWFDSARAVLDAQNARPLRAVVDHDEALMHLRAGDGAAAMPYIAAARAAFDRLGMTGWIRRLDTATTACSRVAAAVPPAAARSTAVAATAVRPGRDRLRRACPRPRMRGVASPATLGRRGHLPGVGPYTERCVMKVAAVPAAKPAAVLADLRAALRPSQLVT